MTQPVKNTASVTESLCETAVVSRAHANSCKNSELVNMIE